MACGADLEECWRAQRKQTRKRAFRVSVCGVTIDELRNNKRRTHARCCARTRRPIA
jgi:hypothetical protein